ncbi:MAG: glycine cleavage system aminomethyltransferase GcvT [Thermoplasmatales archaeon]|nr:glycine cleavage system aminomethyltransferase GcvT [Thermoplasmatales archaeon]MCK4995545.1 glycine cleavage system aminomethyltransferase GcvT [Thermoplasmatales archaeon]
MVKRSPLYELQKKLGARFTEFAGFEMPIQYSSIKDEHLAVRNSVGLFDVSHMSNVWITGEDAEDFISLVTIEDASKITDKKSQYTAILREDGTVIDDTIFMHLGDKYMIIPNAGMDEVVTDWLNKKTEEHNICATAENVSKDFVILAIQGPKSRDTLQKLTKTDLKTVGFFGCQYIDIAGIDCIISHTGYTGELGFELQITPTKDAEGVFNKILEAGKEFGIKPIGLGARDTLRLEKGFILAGNEFEGGRTPLEAIMSWAINWDHDFIGKDALLKQKEKGDYERLTSMICSDKGIPRHGCEIQKDGKKVGKVTSGTMSPCLNTGIAMGYVHPDYREKESSLEIIIRDKPVKAKVVKPPIVPKDWAQNKK